MKTRYGTCYFQSIATAVRYFADYEAEPIKAVHRKLDEGSIQIGKPAVKSGQRLILNDEGRYFIYEANLTPAQTLKR